MAKVTPIKETIRNTKVTLELSEKEVKALVLVLGRVADSGHPKYIHEIWKNLRDLGFDYNFVLNPARGAVEFNSDRIEEAFRE